MSRLRLVAAVAAALVDGPIIYLFSGPGFTAVSTSVSGVELNAQGVLMLGSAQLR